MGHPEVYGHPTGTLQRGNGILDSAGEPDGRIPLGATGRLRRMRLRELRASDPGSILLVRSRGASGTNLIGEQI